MHWLSAQHGDLVGALRGLDDVVDSWYRGGDWANQWLSLRHVFAILIRLEAHHCAAVLHGALVAAGAAYALPCEPSDTEELVAQLDTVGEVLTATDFATAVRTGAAMSDSDLVTYVRAEVQRCTSR